jgi:hypothetical protein
MRLPECTPSICVNALAILAGSTSCSTTRLVDERRHGEAISSSIAESTVNQVISRRFVKKQQMRWQPPSVPM